MRRSRRVQVWLLLAGWAACCACGAADGAAASGPHLKAAKQALAEARTQQKFGVVERGNVQAFERGIELLDSAAGQLALARAAGEGTAGELAEIEAEVLDLRQGLEPLRRRANAVFSGRFPLVRALGADKPAEGAVRVALAGDALTARRLALRAALSDMISSLPSSPLTAVVLVPDDDSKQPHSDELIELVDSEVAIALGAGASATLAPAAWRAELPPAPPWNAPDAAYVPHCRKLLAHASPDSQPTSLAFILVRSASPAASDYHWLQIERRVFTASALAPLVASPPAKTLESDQVRVTEGLSRDNGRFSSAIWLSVAFLAALALASFATLNVLGRQAVDAWQTWLTPPAIGFALGLLLPPMVVSVLNSFAPEPLTAAGSAAWWPCLAGALTLLIPAIVFRLTAKSMANVVPGLYLDGRWGMTCLAVALGICGFWCRPAFLALGWGAVGVLIPLAIASSIILYLFGRAVDRSDRLPIALAPVAILLALALGLGTFLASPAALWSTALACSAFPLGIVFAGHRRTAAPIATKLREPVATPAAARPQTLSELRERAQMPGFQPLEVFDRACATIESAAGGRTVWLALCGSSGSGKTAIAREIIARLRAQGDQVQVLTGSCRSEALPYQPFRELLSDVWGSSTVERFQPQSGKFDTVLQEFVGVFVPVLGMLSSFERSGGTGAATPTDLFAAVSGTLRNLAKKKRVVLFIDNLQWLDEGSAALLRHLQGRLPSGGDVPLVLLLSGRDETSLRGLGLDGCIFSVAVPGPEEQVAILSNRLRVEADSARKIVDSLRVITQEPGGLFWLGRAVTELVDAGAMQSTDQGFALRGGFLAAGKLPVPSELRQLLAAKLRESSQHEFVLECAALLGEEFRVGDVAETLGIDRLELLQVLRQLEDKQRILHDMPEGDDLYTFSSPFILEVIRQEFGIDAADGTSEQIPKIVRELHARLAAALERRDDRSAAVTYAIARHYSCAGARHARKTSACCLRAARLARREFAYQDARRFLDMALKCPGSAEEKTALSRESLLIDGDEAHVTGRRRVEVAARFWEYVEQAPAPADGTPDHETLAAAARACYDAGRDGGDAQWFDRAAQLARRIVAASDSPLEQAAGYHLLGVSLPPARRDEQIAALERGLAILEPLGAADREALLLKARMLGSLAEQLSYGSPADRQQARELLERGLSIRQLNHLGDLPGQARAHGGLGRLAYFSNPPDYATARRHFLEDLRIATEIDDAAGESMCHSFLAGCDRADGELETALEHYSQAQALAGGPKDWFFSTAGMFEVLIERNQPDRAERVGREILAKADETAIPRECAAEIARILAANGHKLGGDWVGELTDRVNVADVQTASR